MRALTAQETHVFDLADGYQVRTRVSIKDSGGTFRDYSNLDGSGSDNWISSVEWDEDIDQPVAAATVKLFRDQHAFSLAPLMGGKYSGYIDVGREVKIETACIPIGVEPTSGDWLLAFHGYIDEIDFSKYEMELSCRDLGSKLQITFIETERTYSNSGGTAVETVMQSILTDNSTGVTLYTYPTSPGWNIKGYIQKKESVLDALTALAAQIGWDVRYKYDSGTSAYRLTFYQPDRTKSTPDYTVKPSRYIDVTQLSVSRKDVRNAMQGVYGDLTSTDATGQPTRPTVSVSDSTSITKYGRQWMELTEASSSNINTSTEMTAMLNAALADLKDPKAIQEVEMHLLPNIEVGDLLRFQANGVHYSSDQDLAVVRVSHKIDDEATRTSVMVRGKPSGPRSFWFQAETRPGVAPTVRLAGPQAPTNVAAQSVQGGVAVTFTPPVVGNWDSFELHASTSSGFTPSSTTFKAVSDTTRFEVGDLTPGTTYYAVVVPRDAAGNRGTASSQVSLAAGYTPPLALQPRATVSSLVPNPDFEVATLAASPPDCWDFDSSASGGQLWGTGVGEVTTDSYGGGQAVRLKCGLNGVSPAVLNSRYFVVKGGSTLRCAHVSKLSATTGGSELDVSVAWYDASFISLGSNSMGGVNSSLSTWASYTRYGGVALVAPSNARYARVILTAFQASVTAGIWAYFDSIEVDVFPNVAAHYYRSSAYATAISTATWEAMDFPTKEVDTHSAVTISTAANKWTNTWGAAGSGWRFTTPVAGTYLCAASVGWTATNLPASGREFILEWIINGTGTGNSPTGGYMKRGTRMAIGQTNNQGVHCATAIQLAAGDVVQLRVYQASGSSLNIEALREANWVTIDRIND